MIAIPNMELPKTCYDCDSDFASSFGCEEWWGWVFKEYKEKRSPDCPLIDIVTCRECIHFHYDKPYIIQGIPVLGHEVCDFWGDGCKTNPNGFCSYGERRSDVNNTERD